MKIWYLTRSFYPYQKGGGPLLRLGQVKALEEKGWDISVVMPNYGSNKLNMENNIIQIPLNYNIKINLYLERLGFREDYLDKWVKKAFEYLKGKVKKEDILFATSGGELGMIKLASLLKDEIGCKFVINFHDPLNYGYMNGLRRDRKFHVGREKLHKKYISNANLILTSSKYYANILSQKFTALSSKIRNNYFGYIQLLEIDKFEKKISKKLRIAYVGTIGSTQSPELLYKAWKMLKDKDIEIYFIGNIKGYKPLEKIKKEEGVYFIDFMPHHKFLKFMSENIDVGFVSLVNDYFGACIPSKIYEYINIGLPIIGALPDGDGKDIINAKGYGLASNYNDIKLISENIKKMKNKNYLLKIKRNVINDRDKWLMKHQIIEIDKILKEQI